MSDTDVCNNTERPHELDAAIEALEWEAVEHRERSAKLHRRAGLRTSSAARSQLAADQCRRAAELLSARDDVEADGAGGAEPTGSVGLLWVRANEYQEDAEVALDDAAMLDLEARGYAEMAEELERDARLLRAQS